MLDTTIAINEADPAQVAESIVSYVKVWENRQKMLYILVMLLQKQ